MTCSVQSRPTASHVLQGITGHPVSLPALNRARGGQWLRCHPTPRPQPQEHHMTVKNIRNHLPKVRWVMEMSSSWMLKSFARSVSCLRTSSDTCQRVAGSGFRIQASDTRACRRAGHVRSAAPPEHDMPIKDMTCAIKGMRCKTFSRILSRFSASYCATTDLSTCASDMARQVRASQVNQASIAGQSGASQVNQEHHEPGGKHASAPSPPTRAPVLPCMLYGRSLCSTAGTRMQL